MIGDRERLPDRRGSELADFTYRDRRWTLGISRFPSGAVAEIFVSSGKGDDLVDMVGDAAILASLALQHGCRLATIRHAIEARGGVLAAGLAALDEGARS